MGTYYRNLILDLLLVSGKTTTRTVYMVSRGIGNDSTEFERWDVADINSLGPVRSAGSKRLEIFNAGQFISPGLKFTNALAYIARE